MGQTTKISWTSHTFNVAHGCTKVSPGCKNCYAEHRIKFPRYGNPMDIWGPGKTRRTFGEAHWREPLKWNREASRAGTRAKVFCSSMCDIFEDHPTIIGELAKLWPLIRQTPHLDWQLLTKRHERIASSLPADWNGGYPNVWLGVSIENADYVHRADALRVIPAAVHFISYEPALGPIAQSLNLDNIQWVIYGGESGNGSKNFRPEDKQWARDMEHACKLAGTAFFFKQSAAVRTEMGVELDGRTVHNMPRRTFPLPVMAAVPAAGTGTSEMPGGLF